MIPFNRLGAISLGLSILLILSCTPEEEPYQAPFPSIPDGQVGVVLYHNLLPNEYAHTTRELYRDSILDYYGTTRSLAFRRSRTDRNRFTIEVQTLTPAFGASPDCADYQGTIVVLDEGNWYLVDLEADDKIVGVFTTLDYGQVCEPFWVPFL